MLARRKEMDGVKPEGAYARDLVDLELVASSRALLRFREDKYRY